MRYQSLKLNLNLLLLLLLFTEWFQTEEEFTTVFEEISLQELNKSLPALSVKTAKPNFNGNSFFFFHYGSVNSKRAHPPPPPPPPGHLWDICNFVLEKLQMPNGRAQKYSANSPPLDNTKIVFSSK